MANSGPDQFILRLPPGMRDRIREAAEQHHRSMNSEIVAVLAETFPEPVDPLANLWDHLEMVARQAREGTIALSDGSGPGAGEAMPFEGGVPELLARLARLAEPITTEDGAVGEG